MWGQNWAIVCRFSVNRTNRNTHGIHSFFLANGSTWYGLYIFLCCVLPSWGLLKAGGGKEVSSIWADSRAPCGQNTGSVHVNGWRRGSVQTALGYYEGAVHLFVIWGFFLHLIWVWLTQLDWDYGSLSQCVFFYTVHKVWSSSVN